jgi:hypothetical protein
MIETQTSAAAAKPARAEARPLAQHLLEWRIVGLSILAILLITAIPYLYAWLTAPAGVYYTGLMLGVPDHLQYFAWMRDLAGQNLASNRLTAEPNNPAFFNLLWWAVGRAQAALGLELGVTYALLRVCAIGLCMSCAYAFFLVTVPDRRQRHWAFAIFAFSGGMGIIWVIAKYAQGLADVPFPDDLYTAEANNFFMSLAFPHFTLATGLLTASFAGVLQAMRTRQLRWALLGGVAAVLLGTQHTYDLITIYLVLGGFGALVWARDRRFPTFLLWCGLIVVGMSAPPAIYMFLLVKLDPIWGAVLAQFDNAGVFTPPLYHLLILLGIPFWLALAGFRPRMLQSASDAELFVATWFVAHFILAYIPTDFQIHMLLGWQVPMAILAASALLNRVAPWVARRARVPAGAVLAVIMGLSMVTNIYLVAWRVLDLGRYANPYFLTSDQTAALDWLEGQTTRADVVLADLSVGQFVPMWTDSRSFLAHWANTLDYFGKQEQVAQIMDGTLGGAERDALLDQFGVTYLVYQRADPPPWEGEARYRPVFTQGGVAVYQIVR